MSDEKTTTTEEKASGEAFTVPPPLEGGELVALPKRESRDEQRQKSFAERPTVWSTLPKSQKDLLKQKSPLLNETELASAMELAFAYGLDPYSGEIWFTKSEPRNGTPGKLLIMVGRDGIRKIVTRRNGMWMDCDAIYENDEFCVIRLSNGRRTVTHSYGNPSKRGKLVAAWAEVRRRDKHGRPIEGETEGFFIAYLDEYKPANPSSYSPWAKQVGVMLIAAAERQAGRQSTPLSGLLVEGEEEVINATAEEGNHEERLQASNLPGPAKEFCEYVESVGFGGYEPGVVELILNGTDEDFQAAWIANARKEVEEFVQSRTLQDLDVEYSQMRAEFGQRGGEINAQISVAEEAANDDLVAELTARRDALMAEYEEYKAQHKRRVDAAKGVEQDAA